MIRRVSDELWNKGNVDICDEVFAQNCSFHDPSFHIDGITGMKQQVRELRTANPDLHMDIQEVLAEGDLTAARWTMGGTARGEFQGIPGTGKSYVMTGMIMDKWQGDHIVEEWVNYDLAGTLQQIGIMPTLEQIAQMSKQRAAM
ncbi:ester cyclase [Hamadaea tsunoensis]|uniref:ester cyclase n=1 Tax=Hamadaea tsunoensis TaxID=53368 RepID=UPI00041DFE6F|nr:ester cyclase [Hamadaea tsunoensis]